MKRGFSTALVLLLTSLSFSGEGHACSIFAVSDGQTVLAGNNEDDPPKAMFTNPMIHFLPAGKDRRFGSMNYTFDDGFPEGGLNTAGLFFDINQLPAVPPAKYPEGTPEFPGPPGAILVHVLANSRTVAEALVVLHKYKLPAIEAAQIFLADRTGDAAVVGVGRDGTITETRKSGKFLLSTNFNLNNPQANFPEPRFDIATRLWSSDPTVSRGNVLKLLGATHFEGPSSTIYSQVYDLRKAEATFYWFHNYAEPAKVNLESELRKRGEAVVPMRSYFSPELYSMQLTHELACLLDKLRRNQPPPDNRVPEPEPSCN